jgi:hypothetical protein
MKLTLYLLYILPPQILTLSEHPEGETDNVSHLPHQDSQVHHHKQSPELHTFLTCNQ